MQTPSITFEHPLCWLLLPVLAALFWWIARRGAGAAGLRQYAQATVVRCCAAALIIGAMSAPVVHFFAHGRSVVFLVDESRSISPAERSHEITLVREAIKAKAPRDQVGVIAFGADPSVNVPLSASPGAVGASVTVNDDATDIGAALRLAGGQLQPGGGNQIVLLSDGVNTASSAGDPLSVATSGNAPISAVDPAAFLGQAPPEASVSRVDLPLIVHENEPVAIRAVVASSVPQSASVTATLDGKAIASRTVQLSVGKNLVSLSGRISGAGIRRVAVSVDAPQDTLLENNAAAALTRVIGKPRILYLSDAPQTIAPTLQRAMQAQSVTLDVKPPLQAPTDVAGFAGYDSVVLSNVPASEMTHAQQAALVSAVGDFGVGLGMVGGTSSFIGGGWRGTPVESALPVTMVPHQGEKIPAADVVIVLDASNSMSEEEGGVEKVQLAARAAVALLGTLQPVDRVAVISVTETPTLVLPFSTPAQALAARKSIEGVEAGGGGIYCLTGLEAAYDLLDTSHAAIKHVVLCADTSDSEEQQNCVELARRMRLEEHITTSCCGIGEWSDGDVGFQREVSSAGNGQLFVVSQAADLPSFFQRDISHIQAPPYEEGSFIARPTAGDALIANLPLNTAPPLLGYDLATARPGASVALRAPSRPDPFLAYQEYGLGRTFAFTSDETAHWGARWLPWPGYGEFWSRVLRWSLRRDQASDFQMFTDLPVGSSRGHIVVDAFLPDGSYRNGAAFRAVVASPPDAKSARGERVEHIDLKQTGPGRYEADFAAGQVGQYLVSVSRPGDASGGVSTVGVSQSYLAEYAQNPPDLSLLNALAQQTGGALLKSPADVWSLPQLKTMSSRNVASLWLLLGTALFLLDVAWRRLGWRVRSRFSPKVSAGQVADVLTSGGRLAAGTREKMVQRRTESAQRTVREQKVYESDLLSRPIGGRGPGDAPPDGRESKYGASLGNARSSIAERDSEADAEEFPLVASLDDIRRRERSRADSDKQNTRQ